ncbi:uncharacterized protein YMR317W-like isoform X2 [Tetranychus urticae]|uniref:uncharacterized protein YMR317W-like isoform X2 n=1 Tax=Tetranychus urticae TaxID=32264 RepID=UPI00077C0542|nr:uncharacterized protein YMR317W-like isoform X2 [Tetranychus urticae]
MSSDNYYITLLYNLFNLMLLASSPSQCHVNEGHAYLASSLNDNNQKCPQGFPSELDAASKAYLSPIVFNGKLVSLSEDYGGKIAATFRIRKLIKNTSSSRSLTGSPTSDTVSVDLISGSKVTLYFVRTKKGKSVPPYCPVHLNETSIGHLRPQQRYFVFAAAPLKSLVLLQKQQFADSDCSNLRTSKSSSSSSPLTLSSTSSSTSSSSSLCFNYLTSLTSPELHNKRSARAVRKILSDPNWARAPEVKGLNGDLKIQLKSKLRLKCKVNGNPLPWIEWFKNGKSLKSKGRISIRSLRRDVSLLEIKPVLPMDTGYYECKAINVIAHEPSIGKVRVIVTSLHRNRTLSLTPSSSQVSTQQPSQLSSLSSPPSTFSSKTSFKLSPSKVPPYLGSSLSSQLPSQLSSHSSSLSPGQSTSTPSSTLSSSPSSSSFSSLPLSPSSSTTPSSSDLANPWHAKGRPCPHNAYCLNGGTCTFYESVGEYACHCAEGFMGLRCNFKNASVKGRNSG